MEGLSITRQSWQQVPAENQKKNASVHNAKLKGPDLDVWQIDPDRNSKVVLFVSIVFNLNMLKCYPSDHKLSKHDNV